MPTTQEQIFLDLVRENAARLGKICRAYTRDADEQEDLRQEMLLQLWRSLPSFAGGSSAGTWLYRVALNTALAFTRRRSARRETALDDTDVASDNPRADEQLESEQRAEGLHEAIDRLGPIDKMLVAMLLDDRSYRDMADVLGMSESNVGVKLHRIKKTLATWLAREMA